MTAAMHATVATEAAVTTHSTLERTGSACDREVIAGMIHAPREFVKPARGGGSARR